MKLDRDQVLMLLLQQAEALRLRMVRALVPYTYQVEVHGVAYTAAILARSSDFYTYRLNLIGQHLSLVICATHDSCLPISVLELESGYQYAPKEVPNHPYAADRTTALGSMVLVGQLLCGVQSAYDALAAMPRATRYRYLSRLKCYLRRRRGRPMHV